ncbi:MAG: oxygen-independent coproporphyrinogen III oxidase [Micavibrio aeruginosavorus]|uniref:Coproporphyrinogen-III oxidase n=1 Tax=Micavibrio aeruginosavorus TaxID=349221 RepID=A0A7T5R1F9_9BACT|nr:MAG: oxygen-independent coproporphyrinogen III oxidase [Micavibrio aeruginosavorus]
MNNNIKESILKHDRMVPRYTSYPTAPHFKSGATQDWYRKELEKIPARSPISLYVHVPFCSQLCWFCGCHTRVTSRYSAVGDYTDWLLQELSMLVPILAPKRLEVRYLHFGGGSPTMLRPSDFRRIVSRLRKIGDFTRDDLGVSVEIDPRAASADKLSAYQKCGVNRASLGVQDFNQQVMNAVNRSQDYDTCKRATDMCRAHGINNVNIDLMYGLPYQTRDSIRKTAEQALTLEPQRISLFGYAHVPWMKKHMRLIQEDALPSVEDRLDLFEDAAEVFENAGYVPIGIDHFCKESDNLVTALRSNCLSRNFQGYTDDNCPYLLAVGASGISRLGDVYVQNYVHLPPYRDRVLSGQFPFDKYCEMTESDKIRARVIEKMMCNLSVNPLGEAAGMGIPDHDFSGVYESIMPLVRDGLAQISSDGTVHALARQSARLICASFDQYLPHSSEARHVTSS